LKPLCSNSTQVCEPIKPDAPVTSMVLDIEETF
jgi:hypothetical protein